MGLLLRVYGVATAAAATAAAAAAAATFRLFDFSGPPPRNQTKVKQS